MNKQLWLVWRNRLTFILPITGGLIAAAVGIRMLILTNFLFLAGNSWAGAEPTRWDSFLVAGICWRRRTRSLTAAKTRIKQLRFVASAL